MVRANQSARRSRFIHHIRRQWSAKEKLMVIHYLEQSKSVRGTARKFNIQPKQVREWRKIKDQLIMAASHIEKLHPGKKATFPELEEDLAAWIKETRDQRNAVTRMMVTQKAKNVNMGQQYEIENDYIELANNIELIDLTNEEAVWVETEDIDNIYSEETI
ncbi:12076_t:CDS:2, partial [Racocetra fulgida]